MDSQAHDRAFHTIPHRWRVTASHPDRPDYAMHWSSAEAANIDARYLEAMGYSDVAVTDLGGAAIAAAASGA